MIPIRRALVMEMRLNSGRFGLSLALCGLSIVIAMVVGDGLMAVLPIWASLAWYRYGRADTVEQAELRAGLGLSRADRVRGRAALIALETTVLLLTSALWLLLAPALGLGTTVRPGPTFTLSGPPGLSEILLVLVGTAQAALVLLLTAIVVGGDCVTHRPARSMAVMSIIVYLGAGLLSAALVGLPLSVLELPGTPSVPYLVVGAGVVAVDAALLLVLRRRVRAWIALLDSVPARRLQAPA